MMLKLLAPVFQVLDDGDSLSCRPMVQVTETAELSFYNELRAEMKKKTWEVDGGAVRRTVRSRSRQLTLVSTPVLLHQRGRFLHCETP